MPCQLWNWISRENPPTRCRDERQSARNTGLAAQGKTEGRTKVATYQIQDEGFHWQGVDG
jgi:hypothetical protein